jgi:GNAT superfamily N-acetyltransferase
VSNFVVLALPRSRTAWMARFLTYGDWLCGHDEVRHARSLDDLHAWLGMDHTGTVETAVAPFWRWLASRDVRIVVVRRPVDEVVVSLTALGVGFEQPGLTKAIARLDRKLSQIVDRVPGVLALDYSDLATEAGCARLFEYCLGISHDQKWWTAVSAVNIQISMPHLLRYYEANRAQLNKLALQVKHRIIAGMGNWDRPTPDGVTFQVEPFRSFYADAEPLFREHLVQTGQSPEDHAAKNLSLLATLDDIGALQCLTARSNGRMFGYLMSVIAPSLDSPDVINAEHTIFFASPHIKGLGMRLQRAALDALRARGVTEVLMRAGHRGSGPRLGTFYRRLGADEFGQLYKLNIKEFA